MLFVPRVIVSGYGLLFGGIKELCLQVVCLLLCSVYGAQVCGCSLWLFVFADCIVYALFWLWSCACASDFFCFFLHWLVIRLQV
jgi:hypothetical protein